MAAKSNDFSRARTHGGLLGTWLGLKLLSVPLFAGVLVAGVVLTDLRADVKAPQAFVCDTARTWTEQFGDVADQLQVIRVDVSFPGIADGFGRGEGVVVAPVGLDLDGMQKVIATAAYPDSLATVRSEGVYNQVWPYAGTLHRDIRYTALTLVNRVVAEPLDVNEAEIVAAVADGMSVPDMASVRSDVLYEAGLKVSETGEHDLDKCDGFGAWAKRAAGWGGTNERFLSIARTVAGDLSARRGGSGGENVCTAIRENSFTPHQAQVAVVAAAREVGLPAFALTGADPSRAHLVAVWTGRYGWRALDLEKIENGYFDTPPVSLAKAPVLNRFPASRHEYWHPTAAAYAAALDEDGAYPTIATTSWDAEPEPSGASRAPAPRTRVQTLPLREVCK